MARLIDVDAFAKKIMKIWDKAESEGRTDIVKVLADIVTPCLAGTPTIEPKQEWISVEDRLPDVVVTTNSYFETKTVLAWADDRCVFGCFKIYRYDNSFEFYGLDEDETWCNYEVTHWMPLPEPPKEL